MTDGHEVLAEAPSTSMTSAFSAPIIVNSERPSKMLERMPLTGSASTALYSEEWLQNLLYRHPQALPVAEIDDSFSQLLPACREMETPAGPIDVVYVTPAGRPVIVEAKLWRNPEARRKVIGQILDYAKELSRWSYETFDAAVRQARRVEDGDNPKGLAEIAGLAPGSPEEARFFDAVSQNLRRGDLLLLIVGDGIREGVGAITEFLEGHASLHFTFGLVEMAIFRMPDGGQLVQPRVLAQSQIIRRIVVDVRHESIEVIDAEAPSEDDPGIDPEVIASREKFRRFWTGFFEKLRLDDQSQPLKAPAQSQNQYFEVPSGSNAWLSAFVAPSAKRAGVYLRFPRKPIGERLYAALKDEASEVERALGVPVEWKEDREHNSIVTASTFKGSLLEDHGAEVQSLLADRINRYINIFRPRLDKLVREVT